MNSMELVSAIITTHNRKPEMVVRAVKSVLRQTYKNIEIIIVDDSSPDFIQRKTVENSVCSLSDKIVYIKNDVCQGACAARNTGLKYAHGEYVGFLDDDDEWRYDKIEKQLAAFTDDSIAMVYSGILYVDEVNRRKFYEDNQYEKGKMFELLLRSNIIGSTSNPLIKKQCINDVGGFDVSMQSSQDYDLWIRIARKYQINYVDAPLVKYHLHPGYRITEDMDRKIKGTEHLLQKYSIRGVCPQTPPDRRGFETTGRNQGTKGSLATDVCRRNHPPAANVADRSRNCAGAGCRRLFGCRRRLSNR